MPGSGTRRLFAPTPANQLPAEPGARYRIPLWDDHGRWRGGLAAGSEPPADLLRQHDDDPLRAADVAQPIAVFVAHHLANELRASRAQSSDGGVDVIDGKCDM